MQKSIFPMIALSLAASFVTPVAAAQVPATRVECEQAGMGWIGKYGTCVPTTKVQCEKIGMRWREQVNKCIPLYQKHTLSFYVLGVFGLGCAFVGFIAICGEWRRSANDGLANRTKG